MKTLTILPIAALSLFAATMTSCTTEVHEHVTPAPTIQSQTTTESVRTSGSIYSPAASSTTTETTTIQ